MLLAILTSRISNNAPTHYETLIYISPRGTCFTLKKKREKRDIIPNVRNNTAEDSIPAVKKKRRRERKEK
jgi:hypothetical protein